MPRWRSSDPLSVLPPVAARWGEYRSGTSSPDLRGLRDRAELVRGGNGSNAGQRHTGPLTERVCKRRPRGHTEYKSANSAWRPIRSVRALAGGGTFSVSSFASLHWRLPPVEGPCSAASVPSSPPTASITGGSRFYSQCTVCHDVSPLACVLSAKIQVEYYMTNLYSFCSPFIAE